MAHVSDEVKTIPQYQVRCAVSAALALCLAVYLLMSRTFDQTGVILVVLGTMPWLVLFFEQLDLPGFKWKARVEQNTADIKQIAMLMKSILTVNELKWLVSIANNEPTMTDTRNTVYYEGFKNGLLHLRGLQFIKNRVDRGGFSELEQEPKGRRDACDYFLVTQKGEQYLHELKRISGVQILSETPE
jgi:hypothetical protein